MATPSFWLSSLHDLIWQGPSRFRLVPQGYKFARVVRQAAVGAWREEKNKVGRGEGVNLKPQNYYVA